MIIYFVIFKSVVSYTSALLTLLNLEGKRDKSSSSTRFSISALCKGVGIVSESSLQRSNSSSSPFALSSPPLNSSDNHSLFLSVSLWWPSVSLPLQTVSVFSTHRCDNPALDHSTTSQPHALTSSLRSDLTLSFPQKHLKERLLHRSVCNVFVLWMKYLFI